jgi:GNAT superfamily N-acetyltransferase
LNFIKLRRGVRSLRKIDHRNKEIAGELLNLQKESYKVEAQILNYPNLPPLLEPLTELQRCNEIFYGFYQENQLLGAISYEKNIDHYCICRMMVDPNHFKKGIAKRLLNFLLDNIVEQRVVVRTGKDNFPAISLYKKFGFTLSRTWTLKDGLSIVELQRGKD